MRFFTGNRKKTRIYACFRGIKVPTLKCGYWSEAAAANNTGLKKQERKASLRKPSVLTCRGASPGIYYLIPKSDIVGNDVLVKHLFTETAL